MKPEIRKVLAWTFGVLSGVALLLAAAGGLATAYQGRIAPNTIVAGISVGGLTLQQAYQKISEKSGSIAGAPVTVAVDSEQKELSLQELGVTLQANQSDLFLSSKTSFAWLTPGYWQKFFTKKELPIEYDVDETKLRQAVENNFNLHSTAKNAEVTVQNKTLAVSPAVSGKQIDINTALQKLKEQFQSGNLLVLPFTYAETAAEVSTEEADQTKAEIVAALKPVKLTGGGRSFTISAEDQYTLIDYTATGSDLSWRVSEEKLRSYLDTTVASKLNIKMIQRVFQIKPEMLLQEGKDGRTVVMSKLVSDVYRRITEQKEDTAIEVPLQTVAFTDKWVEADYIPGLFPGMYVDINLAKQRMFIVEGDFAIRTFVISSGKAGLPTPKGVFYIKNKIDLAQSRLYPGIWMRYWNALAKNPDGSGYEGYGIHDLPCFNASCTLIEGASHLGRPVSHGCVRLGHENALWFYGTIPVGTPVNIH